MSGSSDDGFLKKLRKNILQTAKSSGYTEFELRSRAEATEFLYLSLYRTGKPHWLIKQIPFLMNPDTMSEQDWIDYLEVNWKWSMLVMDEELLN